MENKDITGKSYVDVEKADVFISWTGSDKAIVDKIYSKLGNNKIKYILSDEKCSGNFAEWSKTAATRGGIFLLVMTDNACNSQYVPEELEKALKEFENDCNRFVIVSPKADFKRYMSCEYGLFKHKPEITFKVMNANGSKEDLKISWNPIESEADITEDELNTLCRNIKSLIIRRIDNIYRENTNSMPITIYSLLENFGNHYQNVQSQYENLYVNRSLAEFSGGEKTGLILESNADLVEYFKKGTINLIHGPAGCGKSEFLHQLRKAFYQEENSAVVSLSCKSIDEADDIVTLITNNFKSVCDREYISEDNIKLLMQEGRLILFVDGLDELSVVKKNALLKKTEDFCGAYSDIYPTIIFTSRHEDDKNNIVIKNQPVRVLSFCNIDRKKLAGNILGCLNVESIDYFNEVIDEISDDIKDNPLWLSQIAIVYAKTGKITKTIPDILDSVTELFIDVNDTEINAEIKENIKPILRYFAKYVYIKKYGNNPDVYYLGVTDLMAVAIEEALNSEENADDDAKRLIAYLNRRSILINNEFYHKALLEYYAALSYYKSIIRRKGIKFIVDDEILNELFESYYNPDWEPLFRMFFTKASMEENPWLIADLLKKLFLNCDNPIKDYTIMLDAFTDESGNIQTNVLAKEYIVADIIKKSIDGTYMPYGALFWYVPKYKLYGNAIYCLCDNTLSKHLYGFRSNPEEFAKALALVRDVCFICGKYFHCTEICDDNNTTQRLIEEINRLINSEEGSLRGIRRALCELFYIGETQYAGVGEIYPRCFDVYETRSLEENGCSYGLKHTTLFEDELGLYKEEMYSDLNGEYIGLISCVYDKYEIEKVLAKKPSKKISAVIFNQNGDKSVKMDYVDFYRRNVIAAYYPENAIYFDENFRYSFKTGNIKFIPDVFRELDDIYKKYFELKDGLAHLKKGYYLNTNAEIVNLTPGVEAICKWHFSRKLKKITIPDSVVYIDASYNYFIEASYNYFGNLTEVSIPNSIPIIHQSMPFICRSLKKFVFRNSGKNNLHAILEFTFSGCRQLEEIELPVSLTYIGKDVFSGCDNLKKLVLPKRLKPFVPQLGLNENVEVVYIESEYDTRNKQRKIDIPYNTKVIENSEFLNYTELEEINIPNSVTTIENMAFENCCNLKELYIPNSVKFLGKNIICNCNSLKKLHITKSLFDYYGSNLGIDIENIEINFIEEEYESLGLVDENGNLNIPKSITEIGKRMLFKCSKLKRAVIPDWVTKIGACAFEQCENLEEIETSDSVTQIEQGAFFRCKKLHYIKLPNKIIKIDAYVFSNCTSLTEIEIPKSVKYLSDFSFAFCGFKEFKIPDFITEIKGAFIGCKNLEKIDLSGNLKIIGKETFAGCEKLREVIFPDNLEQIDENAFCSCKNLKKIVLPDNLKIIGKGTFEDCKKLREVIFPDNLEQIDENAFCSCNNLEKIVLPDNLKIIGNGAFSSCENLKEIILPNNLERIGEFAFSNVSLKEIRIPTSVNIINDWAFEVCTNIEEVYLSSKKHYCDKESLMLIFNYNYEGYESYFDSIKFYDIETGEEIKF